MKSASFKMICYLSRKKVCSTYADKCVVVVCVGMASITAQFLTFADFGTSKIYMFYNKRSVN